MNTRVEERYRLLTEAVPVQLWTATPDGRLDYVSDQTAKALGRPAQQILADGWQNVVHADDLQLAIDRWSACLASGEDYEVEFRLKLRDGEYAWHLARAVARRGPSGEIIQWYGTNTNIHEQREASRLVLQASLAKDEFLATVSHELRTPLSAILGWARLLRSGQLEPSAYARGLGAIERNAEAQVKLIEDILDGSRIINGKLHLEVRGLDLTLLVQSALETIKPAIDAKHQVLTVTLDPDASRVTGDPERLQQIVWNLVNNAVKFTPRGGSIGVRLKRSGTSIELIVSDSGRGITPEFLPNVFDRFSQAEGGTTRRHGGLGLGLALVRHLVEAHGGTVRAESEGEGRGAQFRVLLPVQAVFARECVASTPAANTVHFVREALGSLAGVSVLVVDDEQDARDLVATVLTTAGASVTTAANVAQAVAMFAKNLPMVIVSDVGMPEADGYELIRRIRASGVAGAAVPAVALTAYAQEQDRRLAMDAGFQTHVAKPVEPVELVRVVRSIVRFVGPPSSASQ